MCDCGTWPGCRPHECPSEPLLSGTAEQQVVALKRRLNNVSCIAGVLCSHVDTSEAHDLADTLQTLVDRYRKLS